MGVGGVDVSAVERIAAVTGLATSDLEFLSALDGDAVAGLADRIELVGPERDRAVDEAIEGALKMVPRMLRGTVRRVLFAGAR